MDMSDVLGGDVFGLTDMTAAINQQPHVPGRLAEYFEEEGIATKTALLEEENGTLTLVQSAPRGAPGQPVHGDKRKAYSFTVPHLPQEAQIMADEIIGVREFGTSDQRQTLTSVRDKRLAKMRYALEATLEWHRVGAMKGVVLDADGSTLHNLFTVFGLSQQTLDFVLDNDATKVRAKCDETLEKMEDALGNAVWTQARGFCGKTFWQSLITHPNVEKTWLNTQMAAELRGDTRVQIEFGGIVWERYRGKNGATPYIADTDAYVFPEGVMDLFITRFAPAPYLETINTMGLPYYAKAEPLPFGKGLKLEAQSNPLCLCTRPRAVIKCTV
jgi:hypothetical protein